MIVPKEILSQHTAVLGKTGSGKTSTAKLLIEQVVAEGARVCVLDPIKSDWWGLTSSRDGKKAGLPFHILGGPRGHVPLHASAGKVIGEIVANGALPLSIIDMADFEPGGQAKFFIDFAPTLLRKMRGVIYLVLEEAHLLAPKERSGVGDENMSIHWAKMLATAGRSKGVRLVLVTQRTQALHNALLGSCDTMIVHRLTAPADQEPVVKWLKANVVDAAVRDQVTNGMASLPTGTGWLCSGEAKIFRQVAFPRIHTYDNTATPTGDGDTREIKTAPVDQEKLRAIIGAEIEKAKADDPRELRKQIAELKKQLGSKVDTPAPVAAKEKRVDVLTDADRALLVKTGAMLEQMAGHIGEKSETLILELKDRLTAFARDLHEDAEAIHQRARLDFAKILDSKSFQKILGKLSAVQTPMAMTVHPANVPPRTRAALEQVGRHVAAATSRPASLPPSPGARPAGGKLGQKIINALASVDRPLRRDQLGVRCIARADTGHFGNTLSELKAAGLIDGAGGEFEVTADGRAAAGAPIGNLADAWLPKLSGLEAEIFRHLVSVYPNGMTREQLGEITGKRPDTGHFGNCLSTLRSNGIAENTGRGSELRASEELFS